MHGLWQVAWWSSGAPWWLPSCSASSPTLLCRYFWPLYRPLAGFRVGSRGFIRLMQSWGPFHLPIQELQQVGPQCLAADTLGACLSLHEQSCRLPSYRSMQQHSLLSATPP